MLASVSRMDEDAIDACWKAYDGDERRAAHLVLYRSGDFEKLDALRGPARRARRPRAARLGCR